MAKNDDTKDLTPDERRLAFEERQLALQERQIAIQEAQLENQKRQTISQEERDKRTLPPSNQFAPRCSVFNPQGEKDYPMPALKCEVHMPWQQKPGMHGLDWEEVELLNLVEPGEYMVELNDGSVVPLNVVGTRNSESGKVEAMRFFGLKDEGGAYGAFYTQERKAFVPALRLMLRQMLGDKATGVLTMTERRRLVAEKQLPTSVGSGVWQHVGA